MGNSVMRALRSGAMHAECRTMPEILFYLSLGSSDYDYSFPPLVGYNSILYRIKNLESRSPSIRSAFTSGYSFANGTAR